MLVTVCGPNLRDQAKGDIHVHAADCTDLARGVRREPAYRDGWTVSAESRADVVRAVYPPDDFGYDADSPAETADYTVGLYFFPCCAQLPPWSVEQG